MDLGDTPEQAAFRREVVDYFEGLLTPDVREALDSAESSADGGYRDVIRRIGGDGWLNVSWPVEFGGRGLSPKENFIFFDETQRLGVTLPHLTTNSVGPTIMRFGTEEQKSRFLPGIAKGDIHFSIGYSEAEAGTDLASLRTTAVRQGDRYIINGQKMWTSLIHHADYVWLAVRTDTEAPKTKGISIIIVPTDAPGFSWTPVPVLREGFTSATYYDNVEVPVENLVGEENAGWQLITSQLNAERVSIASSGLLRGHIDRVIDWARRQQTADGHRVIDEQWVQLNLARAHVKWHYMRLLNEKVAWAAERGDINPADASALKVYGSELYVEAYRLLMEILGEDALLRSESEGALLTRSLEEAMRWALLVTFAGGTNEVQREIIARHGLDLARAPR